MKLKLAIFNTAFFTMFTLQSHSEVFKCPPDEHGRISYSTDTSNPSCSKQGEVSDRWKLLGSSPADGDANIYIDTKTIKKDRNSRKVWMMITGNEMHRKRQIIINCDNNTFSVLQNGNWGSNERNGSIPPESTIEMVYIELCDSR